ncbi:MAG: translocation/assembly module TamB domain-containing protein, partial [Pseudomonadota bacterium]
SVHGDLTLEYKKNNLTVRQILNIGANQFKLLIKKNKLWQARWHIDAPNLNQLSPEFKGQLHTIGNFNGTVNNPHIVTKVTIQNFAYQHWRAHTIKANVNITDLAKANNQAHILVNQLANDTFSPIDIQANLHGNFSQQQLKMALKNSNATVKLMLQGKYANQTWFGHMSQLNIDPTKKQHWQLKQPVSLKLNGKQFQFSTLCLYHGVSSICAQLNWQRQQKLALNLQVKNFHLKSIQHLLPINSKLNGNINLTGRILQTQQQLKTFNFKLNAYNINYQYQLDDEYHKLYIANLLTNTQLKKNNLTTTLHARLFGAETIYGKIALPNFKKLKISAKQKIIGHIDVSVKNVNDLLRVFPHVTQASGVIHGKINLQGTLSRPKLKGKIHWDRGGLRFANWGLKLTGIQAALTGDEKGLIELTAHGNSGRGHFKLNGNYDLLRSIDHGKIHLSGKNLTLFDTNDYNVIASPDLTLTLHDRNIKFNGKIEVPSAEIKPTNFTSEVNYASDDIVYVKEDTQTPRFYQVSGVVAIKLGKYINLNTAGLTGKLAGKLKLFYNNQSITTANGELKIKQGQYKAYGQTLKITTGELNFNGSPIDNPNLNITAVKRIRTIQRSDISLGNFSMPSNYAVSGYMTVGVQISGTLNKYKVKLISSQSSLSQSDILSMLVLGKPVSDLNQGNAQSLLSAASALKLGSQVTGGITQRIQQALGLDEFGIEDDAVLASNQENKKPGESINTSAVVIGKKITNNLFISYSLGLIDPVSIFRARYQLNNRLSLRTEASVLGTGVDMFYTFEAGNRYRKYHEQH